MHCSRIAFSLLLLFLLTGNARSELTLQSFDPARNDRFANAPAFIGNPHDWSGVGRSNIAGMGSMAYSWVTLISPTFGLSAWHASPSVGGMASFFGSNNPGLAPVVRSVVSSTRIAGSDLALVQLNSSATGVNYYPVLDLPSKSDYTGLEIKTFGLSGNGIAETPANFTDPAVVNSHLTNMRMGGNNIDGIVPSFSLPSLSGTGDVFVFDFDSSGGVGANEALVQGGDSGASSFVITSGGPAIIGIHWFQYSGGTLLGDASSGSGDTFVPSLIGELNLAMAAAGSSERVSTIVAVPEPSSISLIAISAAWLLVRRRKSFSASTARSSR